MNHDECRERILELETLLDLSEADCEEWKARALILEQQVQALMKHQKVNYEVA